MCWLSSLSWSAIAHPRSSFLGATGRRAPAWPAGSRDDTNYKPIVFHHFRNSNSNSNGHSNSNLVIIVIVIVIVVVIVIVIVIVIVNIMLFAGVLMVFCQSHLYSKHVFTRPVDGFRRQTSSSYDEYGNARALKTKYCKMYGNVALRENPVCPDPVWKPVRLQARAVREGWLRTSGVDTN